LEVLQLSITQEQCQELLALPKVQLGTDQISLDSTSLIPNMSGNLPTSSVSSFSIFLDHKHYIFSPISYFQINANFVDNPWITDTTIWIHFPCAFKPSPKR
jgi:hypothetical protein